MKRHCVTTIEGYRSLSAYQSTQHYTIPAKKNTTSLPFLPVYWFMLDFFSDFFFLPVFYECEEFRFRIGIGHCCVFFCGVKNIKISQVIVVRYRAGEKKGPKK